MYEHKKQPLAPLHIYYRRVIRNVISVSVVLTAVLFIGTAGFYYWIKPGFNVPLIDAFHNASMILSGMGPVLVDQLSTAGKIFSSIYAIFSGIIFMTSVGFMMAPVVHRFLHKLHLQER